MSDIVIRAENLGKKYQIHHQQERQRYVALRDVFAEKLLSPWYWLKQRRNEQSTEISTQHSKEDFWALKDVSFEIKQGEVVGIIGRNGAGKSTLLKILSRITEPTEGRVRIRGRIASLLEVGTGFHPELTGRENIYLNGAILGMTRQEIKQKFDEIVAFAEIEKFLDTPVKRYSSGMYVRLAFAVAAHLEPEILVVDEVLAVGDAEFQKKCLGKMSEVARIGRTVLFVSHNMAAIKSLTSRSLMLKGGSVTFDGLTTEAIERYTKTINQNVTQGEQSWGQGTHTKLISTSLLDAFGQPTNQYVPGKPFDVEVVFQTDGTSGLSLEVFLLDESRVRLSLASLYQFHAQTLPEIAGIYKCELMLEPMWLASGKYSLDLTTSVTNSTWDHYVEDAIGFDVLYSNPLGYSFDFKQNYGYGTLAHLSVSAPTFTLLKPEINQALHETACHN
jgi:lipopolysaccharide transport system ATP-binding protein